MAILARQRLLLAFRHGYGDVGAMSMEICQENLFAPGAQGE